MTKPIQNEKGQFINCFGFEQSGLTGSAECTILKDWYQPAAPDGNPLPHCMDCPFFKTIEEYEAGLRKYPYKRPCIEEE